MSRRPPCSQCNRDDCVQNNTERSMGETQQQSLMMNVLQDEDTPPVTPAGDGSSSTDTSNDGESNGMRVAQLNDDILGSILRLKEANQQPGEAALAGMGHEVHQLHQQWEQLMLKMEYYAGK